MILFAKCARLELLRRLYQDVIAPPTVWQEVVVAGRAGAAEVPALPWLRVQQPTDTPLLAELRADLDAGEAEAIVLAADLGAPVILDDRPARRRARQLGLHVTGSASVLVIARERDFIPSVRPVLDELRAGGLRPGSAAYAAVLAAAGE